MLVVDDEELNFNLLQHALNDAFEMHYVPSGEACLDFLESDSPDIILLDINMPGMNGYEVCQKIKDNPNTQETPVVFVSALDSLEERIKGYDAGGDDYVIKPFEAKELLRKAQLLVQTHNKLEKLKDFSNTATEAAMQALTSTGELGVVVNYFTQSFSNRSYDDIANTLFEALAQYGLNSALQIRTPAGETLDYDYSGKIKPLESSLLTKLKDANRIYDFDMRSVFNFPLISVLIKNMPINDTDKYGRHKDNLALLVEGANARVESISTNLALENQKQMLEVFLKKTQETLKVIHQSDDKHKLETTKIFEFLIVRVEEELLTADLTEHQEEALLALVTETSDKMNALYENGKQVELSLLSLLEELRPFLKK